MNKKYLILKSKVPKAQWGMNFAQKTKDRRDKLFVQNYGPELFATTPESQINTMGENLDMRKQEQSAGLVGAAAGLANMGSSALFQNALDKNSRTDGFGMEKIDDKDVKLMTKQSGVSGALSGAGTGASIGSIIPGGVGTAIGAGVGALVGGISGLIGGKKKAKQAQMEYEKALSDKMKSTGRSADLAGTRAIFGKQGTKLVPKKKV